MEFHFSVLLMAATIFSILTKGSCLQCYSCNNKQEPKCGKTWELSEEAASKYLVTCEGESVACKKIDTVDSFNGIMMVRRSCWSTNGTVDLNGDFFSCTRIADAGTACYCKSEKNLKDGKPCNGQQSLQTYISLSVYIVSAAVCLVLQKL